MSVTLHYLALSRVPAVQPQDSVGTQRLIVTALPVWTTARPQIHILDHGGKTADVVMVIVCPMEPRTSVTLQVMDQRKVLVALPQGFVGTQMLIAPVLTVLTMAWSESPGDLTVAVGKSFQ